MTEHVQQIADGMEKAGAGVAVGSWAAGSIQYLDHHSQAVLAVCGIIGMLVGITGLVLKWCYMRYERKLLEQEHRARMTLLKQGKLRP